MKVREGILSTGLNAYCSMMMMVFVMSMMWGVMMPMVVMSMVVSMAKNRVA